MVPRAMTEGAAQAHPSPKRAQTRPRHPVSPSHWPVFPGIGRHLPARPFACGTLLAGRVPASRPGAG